MLTRKSFPFPLTPLLLLVGIFYLTFVARVALAPLLPVIQKDLGLGLGEAGSLFLFIAVGYGVGLLGSGLVSSALNHRRAIILSSIMVGGAMLAISQSVSANQMHAGLVLVGLSAGFYLPSGIATLTELVSKEHWGKAMAIHELAPNLGFITAPLLSEALLKIFSWRGALAVLGIFSIIMGVLYLLWGQGGKNRGEPPRFRSIQQIIQSPSFWIMATMFMVSIGASIGVYTMMPLFLVNEIGMARGWANTLIGFSRIFGIIILFFAGAITDRIGPRQAMTLFLIITGVFTLLLGSLPGPVTTPVLLFLQAASAACLFPVGFTILALSFPAALRSMAVSLILFLGFILGGGVVPSGLGYWAESFSFSSGLSLLGLLFLALLPLFLLVGKRLKMPG